LGTSSFSSRGVSALIAKSRPRFHRLSEMDLLKKCRLQLKMGLAGPVGRLGPAAATQA